MNFKFAHCFIYLFKSKQPYTFFLFTVDVCIMKFIKHLCTHTIAGTLQAHVCIGVCVYSYVYVGVYVLYVDVMQGRGRTALCVAWCAVRCATDQWRDVCADAVRRTAILLPSRGVPRSRARSAPWRRGFQSNQATARAQPRSSRPLANSGVTTSLPSFASGHQPLIGKLLSQQYHDSSIAHQAQQRSAMVNRL